MGTRRFAVSVDPVSGRTRAGLSILLSEGSSTSAREAITALGLAGHRIELCDPDRHCLGRFSRFVTRVHRCPPLRTDPLGFRAFITGLAATGRFDVLLPIHEQGFLLAKIAAEVTPFAGLALPAFETYARVHGKIGFSDVLRETGLRQPRTWTVSDRDALLSTPTPVVVKLSIGTASRGVWIADTPAALRRAADDLDSLGAAAWPVLLQELVAGPVEHAQSVFAHGKLVGSHQYRQLIRGLGGGEALKESVVRPAVRADMARLGAALAWHGALSVDYILPEGGAPLYVDCNPRLVEPMSAHLAGLDLAGLLVRVSLGETPAEVPPSRAGVRTQLGLQGVLGCAARTRSRISVMREAACLLAKRGAYRGAREELTPLFADPPSIVPTVAAALWMLVDPTGADKLAAGGWGSHLLDAQAADTIAGWTD